MIRLLALVVVLGVLAGCATRKVATAEQVRRSTDGGVILLTGGDKPQAAARAALSTITSQCRGTYEVVEMAKAGTGQFVTTGGSSSYSAPVGSGVWTETSTLAVTSAVYGLAVTYVCREPKNADMNSLLATLASDDLLGQPCGSDAACGVFRCTQGPTSMVCTAPDGRPPYGRENDKCSEQAPCLAPLVCTRRGWPTGDVCRWVK